MKKIYALVSVLVAVCLLCVNDVEARGGRGGGGGGRGGGGGGRSVSRGGGGGGRSSMSRSGGGRQQARSTRTPSRSPSMSRSSTARRPTQNIARQSSRGPSSIRDSGQRSTATRNDVQQFLQQNHSRQANARVGDRMDGRPSTKPADRPGRLGDRQDIGQGIRDRIGQDGSDLGGWFDGDFFQNHDLNPIYNNQGWKYATAAGLGAWLGMQSQPYYYDYWDDYDDGYWGPTDEYDTSTYATSTPDYSQQVQTIESASDQPTSDQWMPLGVFAVSKETGTPATPNVYLQLALNKEGLIAGTYYNKSTDAAYSAEGVVDKESQRAAWKVADNGDAPILETGIYNLTRNEVPVRANFADGTTQEMLLVRLDDPNAG